MTPMGCIFEVLLHQDFIELLGCLMPLLLVVNVWFFLATSTLPNMETKQGLKHKARSHDLVSKKIGLKDQKSPK